MKNRFYQILDILKKVFKKMPSFFVAVKSGFMSRKGRTIIWSILIFFYLFFSLYRIAFSIFVIGLFYFASLAEKPSMSLSKGIEEYFKSIYINREYLRLKYFWKGDFRNSYGRVKWYHLVWQVPVILIMTFYTASRTRYDIISRVYITYACALLILGGSIKGLYLIVGFFIPLLFVTFLAIFPPVVYSLKHSYGPLTLKKLGFA